MRVARHGTDDASHAVTHYSVVDQAGQQLAWLTMRPVTGRTHQLRAHAAHIGHPIVGDPKYFNVDDWQLPGGMQNKLHLHARRIVIPHPAGGTLDVTAPLPRTCSRVGTCSASMPRRALDGRRKNDHNRGPGRTP